MRSTNSRFSTVAVWSQWRHDPCRGIPSLLWRIRTLVIFVESPFLFSPISTSASIPPACETVPSWECAKARSAVWSVSHFHHSCRRNFLSRIIMRCSYMETWNSLRWFMNMDIFVSNAFPPDVERLESVMGILVGFQVYQSINCVYSLVLSKFPCISINQSYLFTRFE